MNERVWVYTISKPLSTTELHRLRQLCQQFTGSWTAHDVSLDASFDIYKERLLIFKVNEAKYNASGCSIDKQLRFVKELETIFGIELLNRLLVAYETADGMEVVRQSAIPGLLDTQAITGQTIVFNNTISTSQELLEGWRIPLNQSWLQKYLVRL